MGPHTLFCLEESNFGIVCLTPSLLESRWLNSATSQADLAST
jgi:hypothetical protein